MSALDQLSRAERDQLEKSAFPDWRAPMLATLTHEHFSDPQWIFERKLDGERILAFCASGEVRLMTRNKKLVNDTYPEIADALRAHGRGELVLDGEIVAFENSVTSFSRLQQRMHLKDPEEVKASDVAVYYYLFDILYLDGFPLERLPLRTRKKLLKAAVSFEEPLRFTVHRNGSGEAFLAEACGKGWEGIIAKRANATYQHKRSKDWLKFKCSHGQELVIGGYTEPKGSRKGFGALLVGYYDEGKLRYAGKVGTGFDDATLERLRERFDALVRKSAPFEEDVGERGVTWLSPELVCEVAFTEWTKNGKLRHPRFLGLRRDKAAEDVVREH